MTFRVTESYASTASLAGLEAASARLDSIQAKMSSGNQITKPSDDPDGTVQALNLRGEVQRNTQYASNATDGMSFMGTADHTYTEMISLVTQARTLVVQGLNTGASTGSTSGTALADQVNSIRASLLNLANTTYNGVPVFGGTAGGSAAYDATTGAYLGNNGAISRAVGPNNVVQINQPGPSVFGDTSDGSDVFSLLGTVASKLQSNDPSLSGDLANIDAALSRMSTAQASEGAAYDRAEQAQTIGSNNQVTLQDQLSDIQDIDIASMAVKMSSASMSYQAALQTTASIRQMSLLQYLN